MFDRSKWLLAILYIFFGPAAYVCAQPNVDYTTLTEPEIANRLALSDEQRAASARILDERVRALVEAEADQRAGIIADSNKKLSELLTDEQRTVLEGMSTAGKLRFNFRQQKWPDVLDWFSGQAELALMMDTSPPGLFTYSDSRDYTPTEAIDLLNSVLLSKGFTLMRREKMLIVVDTSAGIPFELAPKETIEGLASRGRFEIVTIEFPLGGRPVDACQTAVEALIGKHGRVTPLAAAQKLIVTETAGKLRAINQVVAAIPVPKTEPKPEDVPPAKPVFAVYPAKGLDPVATIETLQGLFGDARINADPNAEEIHVNAPPEVQAGVKSSLEKMLANISGDKRTRLEIYYIQTKDLSQLQTQLTLAVPKAQVTVDEVQSRLLVVGDTEQQAAVENALEKLGAGNQKAGGKSSVAVYSVKPEATDALVTLLQQVLPRAIVVSQPGRIALRGQLDEQKIAQTTIEQFEAAEHKPEPTILKFYELTQLLNSELLAAIQESVPLAKLTILDDGKRLSAIGVAKDQAKIETTLKQIEAELPKPKLETLEIYAIEKLSTALLEQLLPSVAPKATIQYDSENARMIVRAIEIEHQAIVAVLEKVSKAPVASPPTLETYPVPQVESEAILAAVAVLAPNAQSKLDSNSRNLIVVGLAREHEMIAKLVQKLTPTDQLLNKVLISYRLEMADPAVVVQMLQELRPDVRFAADTRANRILVTATLQEHPRLQAVIEQLDAAPDTKRDEVIQSYQLKTMNPAILVELLQPLVPKARLSVDESTRRILAVGTTFDHQKLERAIKQIDTNDQTRGHVQTYSVGTADPDQLRNVLMQLVPQAVISANPEAKQMLVWTDESGHSAIQQAVEQFNHPPADQKRQLNSYPIPKEISGIALTMLQSATPQATLAIDESGKQMIAWATIAEHQVLQKAIEDLSRNRPQRDGVLLKVHSSTAEVLRNANPLLPDVAPNARLVESPDADKWLIWATAEEHLAIGELLATLSRQVVTSRNRRTIKPHPVANADVSVARQLIAKRASEATILDSSDADRLIVLGTDDEHRTISNTLVELALMLKKPASSVRVYPIKHEMITAAAVRELLDEALTAGTSIQVNDASNSLVIRATEDNHQRLGQAIAAIVKDLPSKPKLQTRVFRFTRGNPGDAMTVLSALVPAAQMAADNEARTLAATATPVDLARIQTVIEQLQGTELQREFVTKIYRLKKTSASTARSTFMQLAPEAEVTADTEANVVIATASQEQHLAFQEAVKSLDENLSADFDTQVFRFERGSPSAAITILNKLVPNADMAADDTAGTLAVTASAEDLKRIKVVIDQIQATDPQKDLITDVYRFNTAAASSAYQAFQQLAPKARLGYDDAANVVIATATKEDHDILKAAAMKIDGHKTGTVVKVYPFDIEKITAAEVEASLDESLKESVAIQVNENVNSLIIRGSEIAQAQVRAAVDAIVEQLPSALVKVTRVYPLKTASPNVVQEAVAAMVPLGLVVGDPASGSLLVTANEADHARVVVLIEKLDTVPGKMPILRAYKINMSDPLAINTTVSQAFGNNPDFSVSFQHATRTLFVVATPKNHEVFKELMVELDQPGPAYVAKYAKVYALNNVDGKVAASALNSLFYGQGVQVNFNTIGNALVVIAAVNQHKAVEESLRQMQGIERELGVFRLQLNDPFTVENAVLQLFARMEDGSGPSVTSDYDSQTLFVRATKSQLAEIRDLLIRLGETVPEPGEKQTGGVRTIPFSGNTQEAVRQIQQVWPKLRPNQIQVITPARRGILEAIPRKSLQNPDKSDNQSPMPRSNDGNEKKQSSRTMRLLDNSFFVSTQENTGQEANKGKGGSQETTEADPQSPPIVVVPGAGKITIASSDHPALDQLESLLRAIARNSTLGSGNPNFGIYMLTNTGATGTQELLKELFEQLPMTRSNLGDVVIVADERINALIVHGNPKARAIVEDLLAILDGNNPDATISLSRTEIILLKNTQAKRVLAILREVYRTQLTSGGGRKDVEIPEGVSDEVASVLQQINAASSGPILTLALDEATNSIILRAPSELREDVKAFAEQLDGKASDIPHNQIRVIQLQNSKADRMHEVLRQFLLNSTNSGN